MRKLLIFFCNRSLKEKWKRGLFQAILSLKIFTIVTDLLHINADCGWCYFFFRNTCLLSTIHYSFLFCFYFDIHCRHESDPFLTDSLVFITWRLVIFYFDINADNRKGTRRRKEECKCQSVESQRGKHLAISRKGTSNLHCAYRVF